MTKLTHLENILIQTINRFITADFFNWAEGYSAEFISEKMLNKYKCLKSFVVEETKFVWSFKESKEIYREDF